jgi:endonuclease/exonuclease/phosphatase family metal-dependent hydrolase
MKNTAFILMMILISFSVSAKSFSIMSYNIENLFDTVHDEGKKDFTYLPLKVKQASPKIQAHCAAMRSRHYRRSCYNLDWNMDTYKAKIESLARVMLSFNKGIGADIIIVQEIENINALKDLVKFGLKGHGYKYVSLLEGPDTRGIDIGMISRFPIVSEKINNVDISRAGRGRTTRGIMETTFNIDSKLVTIFGNHWPSQGNSDSTRVIASKVLAKAALASKSDLVIAVGDFNQTHTDSPHGINLNILPLFEDVEVLGRKFSNETAFGTHWYRGGWESLDRIFVLKSSLKNNTYVDYSSFDIVNKNFMVRDIDWTDFDTGADNFDENIPWRFNTKTHEGFSDHLPVGVAINI